LDFGFVCAPRYWVWEPWERIFLDVIDDSEKMPPATSSLDELTHTSGEPPRSSLMLARLGKVPLTPRFRLGRVARRPPVRLRLVWHMSETDKVQALIEVRVCKEVKTFGTLQER